MEWVANSVESIKSMNMRDTLTQFITLGTIASTVLIIWKVLMCLTGSESPVVVVLSGSMEPGFRRGDILFLHRSRAPFRTGEIVVYNVEGRPIPIVHRVIEVHEERNKGNADILTKGDANLLDDRSFYANGQHWLKPQQIIGRAVAFVPYVGWATIIMTEKPIIKYMHAYGSFRPAGHNLEGLSNQVFSTWMIQYRPPPPKRWQRNLDFCNTYRIFVRSESYNILFCEPRIKLMKHIFCFKNAIPSKKLFHSMAVLSPDQFLS